MVQLVRTAVVNAVIFTQINVLLDRLLATLLANAKIATAARYVSLGKFKWLWQMATVLVAVPIQHPVLMGKLIANILVNAETATLHVLQAKY